MKERAFSLFLALVLCLGLLPTAATAADSDFYIRSGVLAAYTGPGGDVVIPDGVTEIGYLAFYNCSRVTGVTIPDSVTEISNEAFKGCTSLTSITIPDSVTGIGSEAFSGCTGLSGVTIPDSVKKLDDYVFSGCTGLTSVTISDGVTGIGSAAFSGCPNLTNISVSEGNPNYSSQDGVMFNKGKTELLKCPEGKSGPYTIPDSVTSIGYCAFIACTGLTGITIPDSVKKIDDYAFFGCTGLTNVSIPDGVTKISDYAFKDCTSLKSVAISGSVTEIGLQAFCGCTGLTSITIPGNVTKVGHFAFEDCTGLTGVTISDSMTEIGYRAFFGCPDLTLYGVAGSYAETYAKENDIPFVAGRAPAVTPAAKTAYASTQEVLVDGKTVTFACYALKDENGNPTNYIKLRDLAMILNGTLAQFQVGWDGSVTITTKSAYTPNGSEGSTPYSGDRSYTESDAVTKINGQTADLTAFVLTDDNGGGYTYYKLRDLGQALDFNVGWNGSSIFVETDKPYDAAN